MSSEQIFDLLDEWKQLPNYRAEPRVDIYIALLLPELLRKRYNQPVQTIIPELPLRIGSLNNSSDNKSFKVDFYVQLQDGTNLFVEVKTDSRSIRKGQNKYLRDAAQKGMKNILEGIIEIYRVTTYRKKYRILIDELIKAGLVQQNDANGFYPANAHNSITIIFLQPNGLSKSDNDVVIDFNELSETALSQDDPMMRRFGVSLQKWANN